MHRLDQKLIEISYKKGGPLKSETPICMVSGVTVRIIIADAVIVLFISLQLSSLVPTLSIPFTLPIRKFKTREHAKVFQI